MTLLARQLANGGAERQLFLLAAHLARADWDAHVISLGDVEGREHWAEPLRRLGMTVEHVPPGPVLKRTAHLGRLLRHHEPDIVHAFHVHVAPHAVLALASRHVPVVSGIRSLPESWYLRPTLWERVALYGSRILVCNSLAACELLRRRFPGCASSIVIRNGATLPALSAGAEQRRITRARFGLPQAAPVIGIIARHVAEKRLDHFLHAVAMLWDANRDLRAIVVGTGPVGGALRRLAAELPCASAITFVGEQADAAALIPALDVLCLTSESEGMPNVLLEAGAWAIPVVATRVGGVPEVVVDGKTGLLTPVGDAPAIAACVDRLLRSSALRAEIGGAARRHVAAAFGTEMMGSAYERLYVELTHRARSRALQRADERCARTTIDGGTGT